MHVLRSVRHAKLITLLLFLWSSAYRRKVPHHKEGSESRVEKEGDTFTARRAGKQCGLAIVCAGCRVRRSEASLR